MADQVKTCAGCKHLGSKRAAGEKERPGYVDAGGMLHAPVKMPVYQWECKKAEEIMAVVRSVPSVVVREAETRILPDVWKANGCFKFEPRTVD